MKQLFGIVVTGCIGIAAVNVTARAEQCDNLTAQKSSITPVKATYSLPETPVGMDVDATGVVVNGAVAVGTFTAAFVALWAALSEQRKRKRDDMIVGRLTAAGVATRLDIAAQVTCNISAAFQTAIATAMLTPEMALSMREGIETIPPFSFEEIKCLSPLRGDCAVLIAAAQDKLHVATGTLHQLTISENSRGDMMIHQDLAGKALRESSILFTRAKAICDAESTTVTKALR
ncbi:hypothetical protein PPH94_008460 [Burkholderia cepacia]|uniref:hypothetical protein n=1 Tax=Burkholderia cepacia TaxID=292 RepID=UPI00234935CB|nr:hypothetical protein [Burkholderia cepacia]MDC6101746.1 hypothetical protein [Burkholderia cepacia]MDN7895855.1 hypothetical protein [Burkholderia cepacia]